MLVTREVTAEAEQLWRPAAPWHVLQDRWGNWGTGSNRNFPTGGFQLASSVVLSSGCMLESPGNSYKLLLQTNYIRLRGKGSGTGIWKSSQVIAARVGWACIPAGGMLRLEVQGLPSVVGEVLAWEFHHYQHSLLPSFTALGMKTLLYQRLKTPGEWSIANPRAIQSGLVITPRKRLNSPLFPAHFWSPLSLPPFLPRMPTPPGAVFIQAGLEMPTLLWIVPHFQERRLSPLLLILHDSATSSIHLLFAVRSYPGFYTCAKQVTQGFS